MRLIARFRAWLRRWRRKRASKKQTGTLREFVYLDEVSVYSLIASKLGPIASEFTETQTASLQAEFGGSLGTEAGVVRAEATPHISTGRVRGTQVLRKSIIQTTFKELYELELMNFAMRSIPEDLKPPEIHQVEDIVANTKMLATDGWIVDPENLRRGQVLELEVLLEAEYIFRMSAVISAMLEIVQDEPRLFGVDAYGAFPQIKAFDHILDRLLVGLVPVRGKSVDYSVIDIEGKNWIVHRKLLAQLSTSDKLQVHPLSVVGVAEQSLFWKDIRRVLFSQARFRVLCRIAQDGLQSSWTPVKLADVLASVAPQLTSERDAAGLSAPATAIEPSQHDQRAGRKQQHMQKALMIYATLLAEHYDHEFSEQASSEIQYLAEQHCTSFGNVEERRNAFEVVAKYVLEHFGLERNPLILAQYRSIALRDAGMNAFGQVMQLPVLDGSSSPTPTGEWFLDSEFIAIYW